MFTLIKQALKITIDAFDDEIKSNIDTALLELSRVGVDVTDINKRKYRRKQVDFKSL